MQSGVCSVFPTVLRDRRPLGPYATVCSAAIEAVRRAAASSAGRAVYAPREVDFRSFLERHNYEASQLRKLIEAMLDDEESACGGSELLLESREKFRRFFNIDELPDPTHNGYRPLGAEEWADKFGSSLRRFYHHVSEKHDGELIEVSREFLPGHCAHPEYEDEQTGTKEWVPEVHSPQFFVADDQLPPHVRTYAVHFFKQKWWRDGAASGARAAREEFFQEMWGYPNTVWQPADEYTSEMWQITFHSLDSLVWEVVRRSYASHDITFGDLYLFFCRCEILARARTHSTPGGYNKRGNRTHSTPGGYNKKGKAKGKGK